MVIGLRNFRYIVLLIIASITSAPALNAFALRWCDPNGATLNFSYVENNGKLYASYLKPGQCWHDGINNAPLTLTLGNQYTGYPGLDITIENNNETIYIVPCKNADNGIALFKTPLGTIDDTTCASLITSPRTFYGGPYCKKDGGKTALDVIDTGSCFVDCKKGVSACNTCYNDEYDFSTKTCWNR